MSSVRVGDLFRYRGRRPRVALPLASVVEADAGGGRHRLNHTYTAGPVHERRTWIREETLRKDYELVGRQEVIVR